MFDHVRARKKQPKLNAKIERFNFVLYNIIYIQERERVRWSFTEV